MIKAIFLDLDNTLYDQSLYFSSSFAVISQYLRDRLSLRKEEVLSMLWEILKTKGSMYPKLFDDLLTVFGVHEPDLVKILIHLFHTAPVKSLLLYVDSQKALPRLAQKYRLGLITNGNSQMQQSKVKALGLQTQLAPIVYTHELGLPKPHPYGYIYALEAAGVSSQESIYLGDNPYVDFLGAKQVGMHTIRLIRGEFAEVKAEEALVDREVKDFYELENLLQSFSNQD